MAATTQLTEALAQANRLLQCVSYRLTTDEPDLDDVYDLADHLLQQIGLARIIEANMIRQTIAGGANHG